MRGGVGGSLAAWLGFTLPSVVLLVAFAYGYGHLNNAFSLRLLHGLKLAAVAVVAQAVWSMGRTLCPDRTRASIAVLATVLVVALGATYGQVIAIVLGAASGAALLKTATEVPSAPLGMPGTKLAQLSLFAVPERATSLIFKDFDLRSSLQDVRFRGAIGDGRAVISAVAALAA
jgi:chromate transporter